MTISGAADLPAIQISNNADWPPESYTVKDEAGVIMPLTGCVVRMQLRAVNDPGTARLDLSTSPIRGIVINNEAGGVFTVAPPFILLSTLPAGEYLRDIVIHRGPEAIFAGRGPVTILHGITR